MANTQFVVNAYRYDPYKNFKFRIRWDGKVVAGISKVSALKQSTEPVTHREGGDPSSQRVTPSVWKFEPITVERGVTHDAEVGSSRVDLQACKLEYSIVSPK